MSRDQVSPELIERFEARALQHGAEVAQRFEARTMASAVDDEVRHGKPGTVRSANAVFVYRATKRLTELIAWSRSRREKQHQDQTRYAQVWVDLLGAAVQQQPSPRRLGDALRALRSHGFPNLNPQVADRLLALGDLWPSQALPQAAPREMTRPRRRRATTEGRHGARAHVAAR
jgi:hypothetical protein